MPLCSTDIFSGTLVTIFYLYQIGSFNEGRAVSFQNLRLASMYTIGFQFCHAIIIDFDGFAKVIDQATANGEILNDFERFFETEYSLVRLVSDLVDIWYPISL